MLKANPPSPRPLPDPPPRRPSRDPAAPPLHYHRTTPPVLTPSSYLLLIIILIPVNTLGTFLGYRRLAAYRIIPGILSIAYRSSSSSSSPGVNNLPPPLPPTRGLRLMVESRQAQQASLPVFLSQPLTACVITSECASVRVL